MALAGRYRGGWVIKGGREIQEEMERWVIKGGSEIQGELVYKGWQEDTGRDEL